MKLNNIYKKKVGVVCKKQHSYISITPMSGLKSLEQFRFLIKKCFREISKKHNINHSKDYVKYVSVIEVNESITKGFELLNKKFPVIVKNNDNQVVLIEVNDPLREMGYHTHIFFETDINEKNITEKEFLTIVKRIFLENGIEVNHYYKEIDISSPRFVNYHTKQLTYLDETFIISNLTPKKCNKV